MVRVIQNSNTVLAGVLAGNLYRVLNCLSTRVAQHGALGVVAGGVLGKELSNLDVTLVGGHGEADVGEVCSCFRDSSNNCIVGVANGGDANAGCEVDELVAVNILNDGAVGVLDVDGEGCTNAGRNYLSASFVHFL